MSLQVIFGTGPVGLNTAQALLEQGYKVRLVNRSGKLSEERKLVVPSLSQGNWEIYKADAQNEAEVLKASEGASHIYHCVNPLYYQWENILPRVQRNLIKAALEQNAILTASENLYMYRKGVDYIDLDTPVDPPSKKGAIRQKLHEDLIKAGEEKGLRWTTVRGSDFFGPGSTDQSAFGTTYFLNPLFSSKKISLMGNGFIPHSYTYVKDFGRALALAAHSEKAWGKPWIVSNREVTSTEEIARMFMDESGKQSAIGKLSRSLITFLGLFNPIIRELPEMLYQKEEDYVVKGSQFEKEFNFVPTPLAEGIKETLSWYDEYRKVQV